MGITINAGQSIRLFRHCGNFYAPQGHARFISGRLRNPVLVLMLHRVSPDVVSQRSSGQEAG